MLVVAAAVVVVVALADEIIVRKVAAAVVVARIVQVAVGVIRDMAAAGTVVVVDTAVEATEGTETTLTEVGPMEVRMAADTHRTTKAVVETAGSFFHCLG